MSRRNRWPGAAARRPNASPTASQSHGPAPCTDLAERRECAGEHTESDTDAASTYQSYLPGVDIGFCAGVDGAEDWSLPEITGLPTVLDGSTGEAFTLNWEMLSSVDPLLSLSTPPQDTSTPFWNSATAPDVRNSGRALREDGIFDETHIDPALQTEYAVSSQMEGKDMAQQVVPSASPSSSNPTTAHNPNVDSN